MGETIQGMPAALGSYVSENPDAAMRWAGVVNSLAGGPRVLSSAAPVTAAMLEYGMRPQRQDAFTQALQSQESVKQTPYGEFGEPLSVSKSEKETLAKGAPRSSSTGFDYAAQAVTRNAAEGRAERQAQQMRPLPNLPTVGAPPPQRGGSRYLLGPPGAYSKPSSSEQISQLLAARFPGYLSLSGQSSGGANG